MIALFLTLDAAPSVFAVVEAARRPIFVRLPIFVASIVTGVVVTVFVRVIRSCLGPRHAVSTSAAPVAHADFHDHLTSAYRELFRKRGVPEGAVPVARVTDHAICMEAEAPNTGHRVCAAAICAVASATFNVAIERDFSETFAALPAGSG